MCVCISVCHIFTYLLIFLVICGTIDMKTEVTIFLPLEMNILEKMFHRVHNFRNMFYEFADSHTFALEKHQILNFGTAWGSTISVS